MKISVRLLATTFAVVALGASLPLAAPDTAAQAQVANHVQSKSLGIPLVDARRLVGRSIVDINGAPVGQVYSLVIDTTNGVVEYAVVNLNGSGISNTMLTNGATAGAGVFGANAGVAGANNAGTLVALPWPLLRRPSSLGALQLQVGIPQILAAPRITTAELVNLTGLNWRNRIYNYWGFPYPYFGSTAWYWPYTPGVGYAGTFGGYYNAGIGPSYVNYVGTTAGLSVGGNGMISQLGLQSNKNSQALKNAPVYSETGTPIGYVRSIMVDTATGHVAYVVVQRGGFLGLPRVWYPIPIEALSWSNGSGLCGNNVAGLGSYNGAAYGYPGVGYGVGFGPTGYVGTGAATTGAAVGTPGAAVPAAGAGYAGGYYGGYYHHGAAYNGGWGAGYGGATSTCGLRLTVSEKALIDIPPVPVKSSSITGENNGGGLNGINGGSANLVNYISPISLERLYRHFEVPMYWNTAGATPIGGVGGPTPTPGIGQNVEP